MNQVRCPHCSGQLVDDGTLADQVVKCPLCGGMLTMPPLAVPTVRRASMADKYADESRSAFGKSFGTATGAGMGCLMLLGAIVIFTFGCLAVLAAIGAASR